MVGTRRRRVALALPLVTAEPDLREPHKQAVLASLRWAWLELCRRSKNLVDTGDEESITEALERLLNDREGGKRRAHWIESFGAVTRGSKVRTLDGRIELQPDLHFRPIPYRQVRCTSDWAWFVECKIVDGAASLRLYRLQGIERFLSGEYAMRMPSAAMLGYCRDGSIAFDVLSAELGERHGTRSVVRGPSSDVCRSHHERQSPAGSTIDLTHLWLAV